MEWKDNRNTRGTSGRDSILAIADASYFDWPVLPEAPSSLNLAISGPTAKLTWEVHGGDPTGVIVERQIEDANGARGKWGKVVKLDANVTEYSDSTLKKGQHVGYRVRVVNDAGQSAYSNIAER